MEKKITLGEYELHNYTFHWASSRETGHFKKIGDTRMIAGILMEIRTVDNYGRLWWKFQKIEWKPVDDKLRTHENAKNWINNIK